VTIIFSGPFNLFESCPWFVFANAKTFKFHHSNEVKQIEKTKTYTKAICIPVDFS